MIYIDFSIFYANDSYGHANGRVDLPVPAGPGLPIDLAALSPFPAPPSFSGTLLVEHTFYVEDRNLVMCADVWVPSKEDVLLLSHWLESVPGLHVWPNELWAEVESTPGAPEPS